MSFAASAFPTNANAVLSGVRFDTQCIHFRMHAVCAGVCLPHASRIRGAYPHEFYMFTSAKGDSRHVRD